MTKFHRGTTSLRSARLGFLARPLVASRPVRSSRFRASCARLHASILGVDPTAPLFAQNQVLKFTSCDSAKSWSSCSEPQPRAAQRLGASPTNRDAAWERVTSSTRAPTSAGFAQDAQLGSELRSPAAGYRTSCASPALVHPWTSRAARVGSTPWMEACSRAQDAQKRLPRTGGEATNGAMELRHSLLRRVPTMARAPDAREGESCANAGRTIS